MIQIHNRKLCTFNSVKMTGQWMQTTNVSLFLIKCISTYIPLHKLRKKLTWLVPRYICWHSLHFTNKVWWYFSWYNFFKCNFGSYWAAKQQTSWVIAPWWFSVSLWLICITFVWPRGSLKLTAPSSRSERHRHFASIRLSLALLFIISILVDKANFR